MAVIVVVPDATPVTFPLLTVATPVLLLLHVIALLYALLGFTVAVKFTVPPGCIVVLVGLNVMLVTGCVVVFVVPYALTFSASSFIHT